MQQTRSKESSKPGRVVCKCGHGYGSEFDGLCYRCRGNVTAYDAKRAADNPTFRPKKAWK